MTTRKSLEVSYEGRKVSVAWYAGTGDAAIHDAVRAALGLPQGPPLIFTEAGGAALAVSDALPDGLAVTVRLGAGGAAVAAERAPVPGPRGYPLIGNILEYTGGKGFVAPTLRLVQQHGEFFRLRFFDRFVYVCSDPELVREMLEREAEFPKVIPEDERDPLTNLRKHTAGDGLFTSSDFEPAWQAAHRVLLPAFGGGALRQYYPKIQEIVDDLVTFLDSLPAGRSFLATDLMTRMTYEAISYAGFSKRLRIVNNGPSHPFVDAMGYALVDALKATWRVLPAALRPGEVKRRREADRVLHDTVDTFIRERRDAMGRGDAVPTDLLQLMLTSRDRVTGKPLPDENIRFQLITFLIAGHDTTSGLLSYALYHLATHPEVEARLMEEVDRVLGRDFSYRPAFQDLEKLELTLRVLKESLRLHPPVPAFSKTPLKDVVLGGRYSVPARSEISIFLSALHRNPRHWGTDPARFDPDRFLPAAVRARHPDAYHPFGTGARSCIGFQFAQIEARLVLARLYQRFRVRLADPAYVLNDQEGLTLKPDGLFLRLERRPEERGRFPAVAVPAPAPVQSEPQRAGPQLLVLYGSNMGASRGRAELIARAAAAHGFAGRVEELDARAGRLPTDVAVVIVTSTYNGLPPDNAVKFAQWLATEKASLRGVRFAVLGMGNRQWRTTFQKFPGFIEQRLTELGATPFHPIGVADADADAEAAAEAWTQALWQALEPTVGQIAAPSPQPEELGFEVQVFSGHGPTAAPAGEPALEVLRNEELQAPDSGRSTRHLELALPEAVTYIAGDHLGVYGENPIDVVETVARRCRVQLTDSVLVRPLSAAASNDIPTGVPIAVVDLLTRHVDLTGSLSRRELRMLAARCPCPPELKQLESLLHEDRYKTDVAGQKLALVELLERLPSIECTLALLLSMRPAIKPRYYSISSSPRVSPRACSITVGVHTSALSEGRKLRGLASHFLARTSPGTRIRAFVKNVQSTFRLPADPSLPVILVGAGTGLAPLRGFIQERDALRRQGATVGPTVLFFGCRHPAMDFLYRAELEAAVATGSLTALHTAFSRQPGSPRSYVQDRIREQARAVWPLVASGARVYVCGDARKMAPDVQQSFIDVFVAEGKLSRAQAEARLIEMREAGRYLEDVWAAT